MFEYRIATEADLEALWSENIRKNPDDPRWVRWRDEYISYNRCGRALTFAVVHDGTPVGEGTLLFDPTAKAVGGRLQLADGKTVTNVNALRIRKEFEGQGHISRLVHMMEDYAREHGYSRITIGVEAAETRNLAIYLHWGYDQLVHYAIEDGELVLYYQKSLI